VKVIPGPDTEFLRFRIRCLASWSDPKAIEKVSQIEIWQFWLKGGWAAVIAGYAYLCKGHFAK